MCLHDLSHVLVSVTGFRNAGSPSVRRMQRTPPPPPPGHRGTYRVPTGILTRATNSHQAPPFATAPPPQRGAPYYTQTTAHFTPQPQFPPQPPLVHPTAFHQPYSPISPPRSTSICHSTPPKRFCSLRALPRLQGRIWVRLAQSSQSNYIHSEVGHRRLPNRDGPSFSRHPLGSATCVMDTKYFQCSPNTYPMQC